MILLLIVTIFSSIVVLLSVMVIENAEDIKDIILGIIALAISVAIFIVLSSSLVSLIVNHLWI